MCRTGRKDLRRELKGDLINSFCWRSSSLDVTGLLGYLDLKPRIDVVSKIETKKAW